MWGHLPVYYFSAHIKVLIVVLVVYSIYSTSLLGGVPYTVIILIIKLRGLNSDISFIQELQNIAPDVRTASEWNKNCLLMLTSWVISRQNAV